MMYFAIIFRFLEGLSSVTYSRRILLAAVSQRAWQSKPGSFLARASGKLPVETALQISSRYFWSVLSSFGSISGKSALIVLNLCNYWFLFAGF